MYRITTTNNTEIAEGQRITADLYNRFISYLDVSPKSVTTYAGAVKQFGKWLSSNGITQPTRADILNYRDELLRDHKPTTVQIYIVAVRLFFQWLEQEGIYPNVAQHIKGAKLNRDHKKDYLTSAQVKKIMGDIDRSSAQGKRDYAVLALMFTGGLRTIEVSRANVEDLSTSGNSTILYIQGKGRTERTEYIKIPSEVEEAIRAYLNTRVSVKGSDPLFASLSNNSKGNRLTTKSISRLVKSHFKDAGFNSDRLTAHSTRHTAVTLALLGGESLEEVQQFARHANITTTQIYAHNLERANNHCESTIARSIF